MTKFASLFDAGVELGSLLHELPSDCILAPIMPNGVPVALGIESVVGLRDVVPVHVVRTDAGVQVVGCDLGSGADGRVVIVVDDGVETGTAARAVGGWLKDRGVVESVLAVPVCPRTAANNLQFLFGSIISVNAPLGTQALSWHFEDFDVIDLETAAALLATREQQREH